MLFAFPNPDSVPLTSYSCTNLRHPIFFAQENMPKCGAGAAVHIRGGGATSIMDCCSFAESTVGVFVDFNFDGDALIHRCSFCRNQSDIIESMEPSRLGVDMWSKPARVVSQRKLPSTAELPRVQDLEEELALCGLASRLPEMRGESQAQLVNPARQPLLSLEPGYYALGNTFGVDVLGKQLTQNDQDCLRVTFLGCGDIRNVLETISGWWQGGRPGRLELVLNDASSSLLIRDAMLLSLIAAGVSALILAECWGAAQISLEAKEALGAALQADLPWLGRREVPQWDDIVQAWKEATLRAEAIRSLLRRGASLTQEAVRLTCLAVGDEHRPEVQRYLEDG